MEDNLETEFNSETYLTSVTKASERVRWSVLLLITTSILSIAGLLNSFKGSWMNERLKTVQTKEDWAKYMYGKFKTDTVVLKRLGISVDSKQIVHVRKDTSLQFEAFLRAYDSNFIANALTVHIPFFGVAFDINDLGIMAGMAFFAIFILLFFNLGSELSNIDLAFGSVRFHLNKWIVTELKKDCLENEKFKNILGSEHVNWLKDRFEKIQHEIKARISLKNKSENKNRGIVEPLVNLQRRRGYKKRDLIKEYYSIRKSCFHEFNECMPMEGVHRMDDYHNFYNLLATRQVFILPLIEGIRNPYRNSALRWLIKHIFVFICFLPAIIFSLITYNDWHTEDVANAVDNAKSTVVDAKQPSARENNTSYLVHILTLGIVPNNCNINDRTCWQRILNVMFLFFIFVMGNACRRKWDTIDVMWDRKLEELKYYKSYLFMLELDDFLEGYPYPRFIED